MFRYVLYAVFGFISLLISHFIHFNWIIGSFSAHFSCIHLILPAFIKHFGIIGAVLLYAHDLLNVSHIIPFLAAKSGMIYSGYIYKRISFFSSVIIPAACMILFVVHPIGSAVFFYSFYWFIPMILYAFFRKHLFAQALISAFVAHALGSLVWLYCYQLAGIYWIAALPVVPFERCLIAMGIVAADKVYSSMYSFIQQFKTRMIL